MARSSLGSLAATLALLLALVAMAVATAPAAQAADDAAKLDEAKKLAADLASARKAKDGAALQGLVKQVPGVHNALEHKSARGKLQKELGALLKAKGLDDLMLPSVQALGALNDSKGAYKQLKKHMPGPKDKEPLDDRGTAVLGAVATLAPDAAIGTLLDIAEKSRDYPAAVLAIDALGRYKASKKRVAILEDLVKLISRFMPPRGQQVGAETEKRWNALAIPLVRACNTLTGRKETTPDAWLVLWKENKKRPDDLFNE